MVLVRITEAFLIPPQRCRYSTRQRKDQGLTQDNLASNLGVTRASASKWETEQTLPDIAQGLTASTAAPT